MLPLNLSIKSQGLTKKIHSWKSLSKDNISSTIMKLWKILLVAAFVAVVTCKLIKTFTIVFVFYIICKSIKLVLIILFFKILSRWNWRRKQRRCWWISSWRRSRKPNCCWRRRRTQWWKRPRRWKWFRRQRSPGKRWKGRKW